MWNFKKSVEAKTLYYMLFIFFFLLSICCVFSCYFACKKNSSLVLDCFFVDLEEVDLNNPHCVPCVESTKPLLPSVPEGRNNGSGWKQSVILYTRETNFYFILPNFSLKIIAIALVSATLRPVVFTRILYPASSHHSTISNRPSS